MSRINPTRSILHGSRGGSAMAHHRGLTRRSAILFVAGATLATMTASRAAEQPAITVHKDPNCGCCSGWVRHLQKAGFTVTAIDTKDLDAIKARLGVPDDLAACHTAEIAGYVVEGHVPAPALKRFLA